MGGGHDQKKKEFYERVILRCLSGSSDKPTGLLAAIEYRPPVNSVSSSDLTGDYSRGYRIGDCKHLS